MLSVLELDFALVSLILGTALATTPEDACDLLGSFRLFVSCPLGFIDELDLVTLLFCRKPDGEHFKMLFRLLFNVELIDGDTAAVWLV